MVDRYITMPWELGQRDTDAHIVFAQTHGQSIDFDLTKGPLVRAWIGKSWVGYVDGETCDFIRWPAIAREYSEAYWVERAHAEADTARTLSRCYFIGGAEGAIKIGHSIDVKSRLCALRASSPIPLGLLATAPGGERREQAYHRQFAAHRLHGEWFTRCPEIEAEIARLNAPLEKGSVNG